MILTKISRARNRAQKTTIIIYNQKSTFYIFLINVKHFFNKHLTNIKINGTFTL